jgi:putative ABC transport system permease protein
MSLPQDLRQSLRLLRKNPLFTAVAVLVLGLGIGVNSAIFDLLSALLLRPLTGVTASRLVGVYSHDAATPDSYRAFSYPEYRTLREAGPLFEGLAAHNFSLMGLTTGDTTRRVFVEVVSANYFSTVGAPLERGRAFSEAEEEPGSSLPVAVVSHPFWNRTGDPDLVGKTVKLNGQDFTVVGVAREGFTGTMALLSPEAWIPLGMYDSTLNDFQRHGARQRLADPEHRNLMLIGRLRQGLTADERAAQLETAGRRLAEAFPAGAAGQVLSVASLPRVGASTSPRSDAGTGVAGALVMAMTGLVLAIACLNLANMLLAQGEGRRPEIALRMALGAPRARIVRQLLTEGLVLSLLGGGAGFLLARWTTPLVVSSFARVVPFALVFSTSPDLRALLATLVFCVAATLFFAVGPAWALSRSDVLPHLKERGEARPLSGRWRLVSARNLLLAGQVALSLALIITGGLFVRAARAAAESDPGFSFDRGLLLELDPALGGADEARGRAAYRAVLDRVRALPEVEAASLASTVPFGAFSIERRVAAAGTTTARREPSPGVDAQYVIVGADYLRSLGLPLLRGRGFDPGEETSAGGRAIAMVDEALARRLWANEDPVGRRIEFVPGLNDPPGSGAESFEVVGVVPGLRHRLFDLAPVPHVYVPFGRHYQSGMNLHVRLRAAGTESPTLGRLRAQIAAVDARLPVLSATTLRAFRDGSVLLWLVRTGAGLFTVLGLVALFLALIGVYGLKSYLVARRTREIGIRMALGATRGDVLRLILRDGLVVTGAGIAAGLLLALAAGRLVGSMLYRVSPADPLVFLLAPLALGLAALLAAYVPSRRATRVNPVMALHRE